MSTEAEILGREILERRELRANLVSWARFMGAEKGWKLAAHHILLLEKLQQVTDGTLVHSETKQPCRNLMVLMPPGSAKSSYASVIFPVWFIQRRKHCRILACSHSADLIESFSRECRNTVIAQHKILGYDLQPDSRAIQEWTTNDGCSYRCSGVGAGLAGRRADCAVIDDYLGSEEDADSKLIRDKQWAWYLNDLWPRLKPNAIQIIVANRRHEDDLVGRLLEKEPHKWEVIKIPFFAKENDVLGRAVGERLWSDWFTEEMEISIKELPPRTQAGLYGQEPAPDEGIYFLREWLLTYTRDEYDKLMSISPRIYGSADWAVSEEKDANRSCFGCAAMDQDGFIYILPDIFWRVAGPKELVSSFVELMKRRNPLIFFSEKGHISRSLGPFIRDQMLEQGAYNYITEITPVRAKDVRAQSIRGLMSMGRVKFPVFASWWPAAIHEMLTFPGGKNDDMVDMLSLLGLGLMSMSKSSMPRKKEVEDWTKPVPITLSWIKKSDKERKAALEPKYQGR